MCIGAAELLADAWEEGGARVGRLADGRVVSLAFLPEARAGDVVLLHLGIPVEVIAPTPTDPEGVAA
jgi:hydrogenase maturation factor